MKILDGVNYFFIIVFLLCVAVQYNDPDPVRWMIIYGAAALCSILYAARKLKVYLSVATAVAALAWIFLILPEVWGKAIAWHHVFATIHMISPEVEFVREMGGLLIVVCWMTVLTSRVKKVESIKERS
jgi:predicted membrane protein